MNLIEFNSIQFNVILLLFTTHYSAQILSEIAKFWSTWTFKGPPPPEWTSVDFWLTPPPPLLVHVVVECPLSPHAFFSSANELFINKTSVQ